MDYKKHIASKLKVEGFTAEEIESFIALPPNSDLGDYALPCFRFAKTMRKSPVAIAEELKASFPVDEYIEDVNVAAGYLNFRVNRKGFVAGVLREVAEKREKYGASSEGEGKTVCIDYSSINIAKPFHIGHLSTTVLGAALYRLYNFLGYKAVGINHLGDYGTQFGKLIVAYRAWGDRAAVEAGGVRELMRLYVKYHDEAELHPEMDDEARAQFKKIEEGDGEATELFNFFKEITMKDVGRIYDKLNVTFDSYAGESFYNDKMDPIVNELREKGLLTTSEGAEIVDLSDYDMPPCIILRSDGASLYATRDLAAATYRKNTYNFHKNLYVVAYQQNLHFRQIFKVLELMGKDWAKDCVHVAYGMVSMEDGAMSTRKGKVVFLEDVITRCVEKSLEIITEKNPDLPDKEKIAEQVGTGAVIFGALSSNKIKDMVFSYDKVLNFDGETGPYVQYTCARCKSVLNKGGDIGEYAVPELSQQEYDLVAHIGKFPELLSSALEKLEPSFITRYAVDLAQLYNKFYFDCKILGEEDNVKNFRLALTDATLVTLSNSLALLGISVPERM